MKHRKSIVILLGAVLMFGTEGCELPLQNAAMRRTNPDAATWTEASTPVTSPAQAQDGDAEKIFSASDEHIFSASPS